MSTWPTKFQAGIAFETRLMILRHKGSEHMVVFDIPVKDFILGTFRRGTDDLGSLMVSWMLGGLLVFSDDSIDSTVRSALYI